MARGTRQAMNVDSTPPSSIPNAYLLRRTSPFESRSLSRSPQPRRSTTRSPPATYTASHGRGFSPAIEMSSATPRRKFSDVEISVVTPSRRERSGSRTRARLSSSERYRQSVHGEILQVGTDYTDGQTMMPTRQQNVSPPGVWDVRPASQRQTESLPGTWHGRGGDALASQGLIGSASDYSPARGHISAGRLAAVRPGSAAAGMRQQTSWPHQGRSSPATHAGVMRRPGPRRYQYSDSEDSNSGDEILSWQVQHGGELNEVGPRPGRAATARLQLENEQRFDGAPGSAASRMRHQTSTSRSSAEAAVAPRQPRQKRARTLVYDDQSDGTDFEEENMRERGTRAGAGGGEDRGGGTRGRSRTRTGSFTREFEA